MNRKGYSYGPKWKMAVTESHRKRYRQRQLINVLLHQTPLQFQQGVLT